MRVLNVVLTSGQLALAILAICGLAGGFWKYVIVPAQQISKVYKSIGKNGKATVFENLHEIRDRLATVETKLTLQGDQLDEQDRAIELLMNRK